MREYTVIYEWAGKNFSAYVPDLPGCTTTGKTKEETERLIQEAIALYIQILREDEMPIPEPTATAGRVPVAA